CFFRSGGFTPKKHPFPKKLSITVFLLSNHLFIVFYHCFPLFFVSPFKTGVSQDREGQKTLPAKGGSEKQKIHKK
ncbi:MAG: hypothetical protein PHV31_06460, partial [Fermentimonas sp.]|nr:hypothetical protein [Fermentimonas sp.]